MSKSLRKVRTLTVALLAVIAFFLAALMTAIGAAAEGNVSTTERENTYTAGTVKRAIKVENDSFSVTFRNDCTDGAATYGFAFFNSADTSLNIGDTSASAKGLDFYVSAENINLYNNENWTESTQQFLDISGASNPGWLITPYSVNKKTHITVSKGEADEIVLSIYSEGGNNFYQSGVTLDPQLFNKSGSAKTLYFSDLVDENGYTYLNVNVSAAYPYTITESVTEVSGITFTRDGGEAIEASRLSVTGAFNEQGNELYAAEIKITENGYSFIGPDIAKLEFSDGTSSVIAEVGHDVVFERLSYTTEQVIVGNTFAILSADRWSIGDSSYGMAKVYDDEVTFDIGIKYDNALTSNVNFNICIGSTTWVQGPGENTAPEGVFSLFMYITPDNQLLYEFYNNRWQQFTATTPVKSLSVGEWNHVSLSIKKADGKWGLYLDDVLVAGTSGGGTLDFDTQYGDLFQNQDGRTNIAFTGHQNTANGWNGTIALFAEKVSVDGSVTSVNQTQEFSASIECAYDESHTAIDVFDGVVTTKGYSFTAFNMSAVKYLDIATRGGVVTNIHADYSVKDFEKNIILGSNDAQYDRTLTVNDSLGLPVTEANIKVLENGEDATRFYEIVNDAPGIYVVKGINKAIQLEVSVVTASGQATETVIFGANETSKEIVLQTFSYTFTNEVLQTLTYGKDKLFVSGGICAENGITVTVDLQNVTQSSGFQLYFTDGKLSADKFHDAGGAEYFDCTGLSGIRLIVLMSDNKIYLDIIPMENGEGVNLTSSECEYVGAAGISRLNLDAVGRHTFTLSDSALYFDGIAVYDFGSALWLNDGGSTFVSAFVSRGYSSSDPSEDLSLAVYADKITVENVKVSGVTEAQMAGISFCGFDASGNTYELSEGNFDFETSVFSVCGLNIGNRIIGVNAYTAGGINAQFNLVSEDVVFGSGYSATITPNVAVAKENITIFNEFGQDITTYLDVQVGSDNKIVIAGLENIRIEVQLEKENYVTETLTLSIEESNIQISAELAHDYYSVQLQLLLNGSALENMQDYIFVYNVADTSEKLAVEISYSDEIYTISGIEKGTDVLIVFEADGYVLEQTNATQENNNISLNVKQLYTVTFTVKAGDAFMTETDCITVAGANTGAELKYDSASEKFIISGLTNEIKIVVKVSGYEIAEKVFDISDPNGEIVLNALNFDELRSAIEDAEEKASQMIVSVDGTDVDPTGKWVTQQTKDALTTTISQAKEVLDEEIFEQEDIDQAKAALDQAVSIFEAAASAGLKAEEAPSDGCAGAVGIYSAFFVLPVLMAASFVIFKKKKNAD